MLSLVALTLLVSGCVQSSPDKATPTTQTSTESTSPTDTSLMIEDSRFVRNSQGQPVAIRVVATASLTGSCKLAYGGVLETAGVSVTGTDTLTLLTPTENKLELQKWEVCCDTVALKSFTAKTGSTVCKNK